MRKSKYKAKLLQYNKKIIKRNYKDMSKNYTYKESKITTKKLVGVYDSDKHTIDVDGDSKDIIEELKDFEGAVIEVVIREKSETDLSDE